MRSDAGFTLVEMLAALVAGSLLLAALSWTMGGLSADLLRTKRDPEIRKVESLTPQLARLIREAMPPGVNGNGYRGDASKISLVTVPPQSLGNVGAVKLTLSVVRSSNGQALDMTVDPVDARVRLPEKQRAQRLVDGLADIRFSYLPSAGKGRPQLPRLVTIIFEARSGRTVTVVAEPRLTSDGNCRFDPISMACRS